MLAYNYLRFTTIGALSLIAVILAHAWASEMLIAKFPQEMTLEAYSKARELKGSRKLSYDDPVYSRLRDLVGDRQGWSRSYVSYATGPYVFRSPRLIVRCFPGKVVIDRTEDSGRSSSFEKSFPDVLPRLGLSVPHEQ
jgi:hypothetical protein